MAEWPINSVIFKNAKTLAFSSPEAVELIAIKIVDGMPTRVKPGEFFTSLLQAGDRITIKPITTGSVTKYELSADVNETDVEYLTQIATALNHATVNFNTTDCKNNCDFSCKAISAAATCDGCTGSCVSCTGTCESTLAGKTIDETCRYSCSTNCSKTAMSAACDGCAGSCISLVDAGDYDVT